MVPRQQAVLFDLYCGDVAATRATLEKAGIAVGPIGYVRAAGEFRVEDPDGYVLMITHN